MINNKMSIKKIKDFATVVTGATPLRSNNEYFNNGTIPWVKTTDLNNGKINKTDEKITSLALKETSVKILPKDTVLVAMYGGFNQIGRTGILVEEATTNQALSAITVDKNIILPMYLLNYLNFRVVDWKAYAASSRKDPNITKKDVENFKVLIPPVREQEKIVEILSTWDSVIEKQEQLIEKKKEFKRGLMQRLLSGEVRFKNFKDDWKTYKVNNLTKQVINKNKDGNISLVLSVTNKKGFITQEEQFEKQVASKDLSNYKIVRKGEFAYNPSRINVGSIDLLTKFNEGLLSPMYIVFKCDEQLLSEYYNYWIKTNMFKKQMDKYLSGSVRETLSFEDMGLMKIKLPSMEEQKMIVDLLNNMNTEIELLEKELEALKLQKKGLMQRLLTGEVRVKV
ncbi:MAG: restriction endonuclease subunit S [Clostridium celatum]|nr:restriction endonuclease subunit S [Clostridium celatum]